jgi:hypothetical protein
MTKGSEIIYSSDLVIRDLRELNTCCVFYDKVFLPYTTAETSQLYAGREGLNVKLELIDDRFPEIKRQLTKWDIVQKNLERFQQEFLQDVNLVAEQQKILFQENVLQRLPPPPTGITFNFDPSDRIKMLAKMPYRLMYENASDFGTTAIQQVYVKQDLLLHWLRTDLDIPHTFSGEEASSREFMVEMEAKAVFTYLLPVLGSLQPEQILEVRERVGDTREGFSMHLQKLSKGISDRLNGGEPPEQIEAWAKSLIDTELIPDYREFRRQLMAERTGFWKKVFETTAKVFEIDAAPWTPKFYGQLIKCLGFSALTYTSERKDELSNKSQAFQFMRLVEDTAAE